MPPRRRCPTGPRTMRSCCREVRTVSNLVEDLASRVLHLHVSLADAKSRLMASGAMGRRRGGCARGVGGLRGRKGELMRCHVTLSGGTSKPEASSKRSRKGAQLQSMSGLFKAFCILSALTGAAGAFASGFSATRGAWAPSGAAAVAVRRRASPPPRPRPPLLSYWPNPNSAHVLLRCDAPLLGRRLLAQSAASVPDNAPRRFSDPAPAPPTLPLPFSGRPCGNRGICC